MYKVISNFTYGVIWTTDEYLNAKIIAIKYGVYLFKNNIKINDFS